MKPMTSFRMTALACLWFAIFSLLPPLRIWSWSPVLALAAILLSSYAAVRLKHPAARLPVSLLPLITVWYAWRADGLLMAIVCAVPIVVIAIALTADRAVIEHWRVRREFIALSVVCFLLLIISINPLVFSKQSCAFIGGYLVFGILALRAGRVGLYTSARWQAGNAGIFLLTLAASAGVGTVLMIGFDALVEWLKQFFIDPGHVKVETTPNPMHAESFIRIEPSAQARSTAVPQELFTEPPDTDIHISTQDLDIWWIVAGILLAAALGVLVALLLARQKGRKDRQEATDMDVIDSEEQPGRGKKRNRGRRRQSNNDKVRELYRRYLEDLRLKGITFRRSATTYEISQLAASVTEDDTILREFYRKARYGWSGEVLTDEEMRQAEDSYLRLIAALRGEEAQQTIQEREKTP